MPEDVLLLALCIEDISELEKGSFNAQDVESQFLWVLCKEVSY